MKSLHFSSNKGTRPHSTSRVRRFTYRCIAIATACLHQTHHVSPLLSLPVLLWNPPLNKSTVIAYSPVANNEILRRRRRSRADGSLLHPLQHDHHKSRRQEFTFQHHSTSPQRSEQESCEKNVTKDDSSMHEPFLDGASSSDDPVEAAPAVSPSATSDIPLTKKMKQLERYKERVLKLNQNQTYNFWEEQELSITSFNMDLHNLAVEDPQRAQDALEIMSELYKQDPDNPMAVQPDSASYTTVIEGWCYNHHHPRNPARSREFREDSRKRSSSASSSRSPDNMNEGSDTHSETEDQEASTSINENGEDDNGYPDEDNNLSSDDSFSRNDAAQRAQDLLDKMEQSCSANGGLCPNELSYLLVCQLWAESFKNDIMGSNAQKAHDILIRLRDGQNLNGTQSSTRDCDSTPSPSSSQQPSPPRPSVKLYSIVLEGWCKRIGKVPHAMDRANELLHEMEQSYLGITSSQNSTKSPTSKHRIRPNVLTYTSVIGGLARSREPDLARRAMDILERMQRFGVEPDMVAYTSVLNCWAKAVSREERDMAASKAMHLIQQMEDMYIKEEKYHLKPNVITYATVVKAIGNSFDPKAASLCEEVLKRMYELTESGSIHVPPNAGTYNAVITSLSHCGGPGTTSTRKQRLANARRAESLLVDMIKRSRNRKETAVEPNVRTWGAVLRAWADSRQPDSGEQAQRVLDQLQTWYDEGKTSVRPNVVCYTTVMRAWGRSGTTKGENSKSISAIGRVEKLLREMEELFEETLDPDVRPNKISYVTAIDAICRNYPKDKIGSKAQAIVDRMMRLYSKGLGHDRPTRIVMNALINAWSKSTEPNAAANAEQIFQWMESQYRSGRDEFVRPDRISLCCVLNGWANSAQYVPDAALRAQQILDYTESLSAEERGFRHSVVCHNICIKAWGRSRAPDSVQRAEAILLKLEEGHKRGTIVSEKAAVEATSRADSDERDCDGSKSDIISPDITTYSSVINCCAYYVGDEEGRREALKVALRTFEKTLRRYGGEAGSKNDNAIVDGRKGVREGPNHIVYGTLFKAISKLMDERVKKNELIQKYFRQCCKHGQVDAFVMNQVRAASTYDLFREMVLIPSSMGGKNPRDRDSADVNTLLKNVPSSWTRKVQHF